MPLIVNVIKPLAKSVLISLALAAAATDTAIDKKIFGLGMTTIKCQMKNDVMKIVKFLEESGLLIKGISETIKNEGKEQKRGFLNMLLCILGASLLGNLLTGKGVKR